METATISATLVQKEDVRDLRFPASEVLEDSAEQVLRKQRLERALKLGNGSKHKVKLVFSDSGGMKSVETTIWGLTDNNVILKRGVIIPLRRIYEVIQH